MSSVPCAMRSLGCGQGQIGQLIQENQQLDEYLKYYVSNGGSPALTDPTKHKLMINVDPDAYDSHVALNMALERIKRI